MAKADNLTFIEFSSINNNLKKASTTWSDLWVFLYYSGKRVGDVIGIKFDDTAFFLEEDLVASDNINHAISNSIIKNIIVKRRSLYPDDVFLFQSHSNRIKAYVRPVTVVAFNSALRRASQKITHKNVSSRSATRVVD